MDAGAFQIKNQPKHMNLLFMTLPMVIGTKFKNCLFHSNLYI